jgi:hypothetical protein
VFVCTLVVGGLSSLKEFGLLLLLGMYNISCKCGRACSGSISCIERLSAATRAVLGIPHVESSRPNPVSTQAAQQADMVRLQFCTASVQVTCMRKQTLALPSLRVGSMYTRQKVVRVTTDCPVVRY